MPRKPGLNSEFVMFDVVYEDGTQRSNRKVPRAMLGGIEGDEAAYGFLIEQDREIAEKSGRPLAFYTEKASIFQTAEKRKRDEPGVDKDPVEMPPTQIGRALREPGIAWIAAYSPQAKAYASHCTSIAPCATS